MADKLADEDIYFSCRIMVLILVQCFRLVLFNTPYMSQYMTMQ